MLEEFLEHPFFLNRHRQAPLLKERESPHAAKKWLRFHGETPVGAAPKRPPPGGERSGKDGAAFRLRLGLDYE